LTPLTYGYNISDLNAGIFGFERIIDDIGWDPDRQIFEGLENAPLRNIFKL